MNRFSRKAWFVCGLGLLVMLVAEIFQATHMALYLWGGIWVVGWIAVTIGIGMAVRSTGGWIATAMSIVFTILALYFAYSGANASFMAMSSIAVIAVAVVVSMAIQLAVGQENGLRSPPPPSSITLSLAGVGVILLAGAFALLANGMALGFLAFGFSLGVVGTAVGFGAIALMRHPEGSRSDPAIH
ncbi:MAG: hypothetical protein M3Z98_07980 [Candidatus Dormibacteraeota bacterium]|nr:hypothetical protein [Candidatus Dormibacteraeota bacterium]